MKGIIFSEEMIRAIQDGSKSMTRRIVNPQPPKGSILNTVYLCGTFEFKLLLQLDPLHDHAIYTHLKPKYQLGDVLYVKEKFDYLPIPDFDNPILYYAADDNPMLEGIKVKWSSPIYMPKKAARIFLRVTETKIEKIQDITIDDVIHEGIEFIYLPGSPSYRYNEDYLSACEEETIELYIKLWDKLNGKKQGCSWKENPWITAISFKQISREEAFTGFIPDKINNFEIF